jgi:hypothetical protein
MRLQNPTFRLATIVGLSLGILLPQALAAQFGLAARGSTLGIGVEVSYRVNRVVGVRAGGNYFEFSKDATIENIDYTATPTFESGTAILDFYPMGGSFHLSGGLLLNRNEGRLDAKLNSNIDIGGRTYTPAEVGSLVGTVDFKKTAPYLGIGFAGRGRISILFDLGVGFTGTPRVDLIGQTPLTGPEKAEFDARVAQELAEVRADIEDKSYLKYHPVLSLGLKIGF